MARPKLTNQQQLGLRVCALGFLAGATVGLVSQLFRSPR